MAIPGSQSVQKLALGGRLYNYGFNDTLLFTEAYTRPRYEGSKLIGAKINEYTDYTQSTPEEFALRLTGPGPYPLGIQLLGIAIGTFFPVTGNNRPLGFIKTTKPIVGTYPLILSIDREYSSPGGIIQLYFNLLFKGRNIFPIPIQSIDTGTLKLPPIINGLKDILNQDGTVKGGILGYITSWIALESQFSGGYRRDRSYGKNPVIEVKTNTIYEYDWGESAYPFLENGGTGHLKQILSIDDYSSENISFKASNEGDTLYDEYDQLLKRTLNKGDQIEVEQYIKGSNISSEFPIKQEVALRPSIGTPSKESLTEEIEFNATLGFSGISSSFFTPSFTSSVYVVDTGIIYSGDNPRIEGIQISNYLNLSGSYFMTGSGYLSPSVGVSASLARGEINYISFYNNLGNIARGDIGQVGDPIEVKSADSANIYLKSTPPITGTIGSGSGIIGWRAREGSFITMKPGTGVSGDYNYENINEGGFYRQYSTDAIKQNFRDIVERVGNKKVGN